MAEYGMNLPRPPALTLFHAWQCMAQGITLKDTGEFLQEDADYIVALMMGKIETDNLEVQGVRKWIKLQCQEVTW